MVEGELAAGRGLGSALITLDTSGMLALVTRRDPNHGAAIAALQAEARPYLRPAATLGELGFLIETRSTPTDLDRLLDGLQAGEPVLDLGDQDWSRVRELVHRYADLPLGLVDAVVIACAERNGGRVLTFDLRHFGVVAREGTITIVP